MITDTEMSLKRYQILSEPFKYENQPKHTQVLSPYRAVNTLRHGYKYQSDLTV
jgi:hypothetical protein